jgi:hypothetical protein
MSRLRIPSAGVVALVVASLGLAVAPGPATAAEHRALVVVDTGTTVIRRTITFSEDSISGIAALQRAGADPTVYSYNGQGGAVCRLFGVGRDAGPGCLGGADGDARYWAYFRAPAGSTTFRYSQVGGGATAVHDGDVEGWKFGTGAAPPYSPVPPVTPPSTAAPSPPSTAAPAPGAPGGPQPGVVAASGVTPAIAAPGPSPSTAAPGGLPVTGATDDVAATGATGATDQARGEHRPRTQEAAARRAVTVDDAGGGGTPWSFVLLGLLLAAMAAGVVLLRRARRASTA